MAKWVFLLSLMVLGVLCQDEVGKDVGLTQICIWLPLVLVLTVGFAVYLMATMESGKDSLLSAKFLLAEQS